MDINESGSNKVVFSGHTGAAGYGCCFNLSEINFSAIIKLLYFKIRYEIKERLKKWKKLESLFQH